MDTQKEAAAREEIILTPEQERRRRTRNIAIGLAISAFMLLFYAVTIVKLGGFVARPPV